MPTIESSFTHKMSAKAFGIFTFVVISGHVISAKALESVFEDGERSLLSGLRELRDLGLLELRYQKTNRGPQKCTVVTEKGLQFIAEFLQFPALNLSLKLDEYDGKNPAYSNPQNGGIETLFSNIANTASKAYISKPNTSHEESKPNGDEKKLKAKKPDLGESAPISQNSVLKFSPGGFIPLADRLELERQRQANFEMRQETSRSKNFESRHIRSRQSWSVTDVCYEFADHAQQFIHLARFSVSKSKIKAAFTQIRRKYATNGIVEVAAIELFFRQLEADGQILLFTNVDQLWKMYAYRFPSLHPVALALVPSPEADKLADKLLEKELERIAAKRQNPEKQDQLKKAH